VRFLWFPGQPHGLQKITHQKRKMTEELRWFDTYLFNTYEAENEAYKEDSPLGSLLMLQTTARQQDGRFGVEQDGHLLPQMVSLGTDTISIGLFEVTNAQYQSLIDDYTYPPGEDNYPATGLSRQDITAYLEELSQLTGATSRLPNAREAKDLQKLALKHARQGNTLNYWAGYDPTPADAARLKLKLNELEHSLLKPVGGFKPGKIKGRSIFDLGGNAAEYYLDGNTLGTYDLSAYDAIDEHSRSISTDPAHTGFRVVRE
ncbi:MAG TPA: peptidase S9, partial [Flammeovirgaceae bacterium]|nr:peptidase S9 [Flammeovirgaceae bacterium]